jgi:hypothetical protein
MLRDLRVLLVFNVGKPARILLVAVLKVIDKLVSYTHIVSECDSMLDLIYTELLFNLQALDSSLLLSSPWFDVPFRSVDTVMCSSERQREMYSLIPT